MNTPEISVIVPVYNVEKYLRKCLDSLVNQTFHDLEIIVMNDGSSDSSQNIIDEYVASDPDRIKAFHKENGGLSDARNYGMERAQGKYFGFIDSDDWIDHEMFANMHSLIKRYDADIAICDLVKEDEKGSVLREIRQAVHLPEYIELKNDFSIFGEFSCFACNKLFNREVFENLFFPVGKHFEDIAIVPLAFLRAKNVVKINKLYYHYLERSDSITKSRTEKGLDIFCAIKNVEKEFLKSSYKNNIESLKRFFIIQGCYSFLSYTAFIGNGKVLKTSFKELKTLRREKKISIKEILLYRMNNENYFLTLPLKKQAYYLLSLLTPNLLRILIIGLRR